MQQIRALQHFRLLCVVLTLAGIVLLTGTAGAVVAPGNPTAKIDSLIKLYLKSKGIDYGVVQGTSEIKTSNLTKKPVVPSNASVPKKARKKLEDLFAHRTGSDGIEMVSVLISLQDGSTPSDLSIPGLIVHSFVGTTVTAEIPVNQILRLAQDSNVVTIGASRKLVRTNDVSIPDIHADQVQNDTQSPSTGSNALVGVVDTGVDWKHGDFIGADGKSRILYIWDQTDNTGPHPSGYNYGTEYTKSQIDAALAGTGTVAEADNDSAEYGHGTHVLGTAAGNGRATGNYKGVAPEAGILFVKADWDDAHAIDANQYLLDKATQLGKPIAVNNSWGDRSGSRDDTSPICKAFDAMVGTGKPGKVVCFAAGNDGQGGYHAGGSVLPGGGNFLLAWSGESYILTADIFVPASKKVAVSVGYSSAAPDLSGVSDASKTQDDSSTSMSYVTGTPAKDTTYTISDGPFVGCTIDIDETGMPFTDNTILNKISISIDASSLADSDDIWNLIYLMYLPFDINIANTGTTSFHFDAWPSSGCTISTDSSGQSFLGDGNMTILEPGTAKNVITAAAYVTKTSWIDESGSTTAPLPTMTHMQNIAYFSSLGPLRDGSKKPDIAAPGMFIVSALSSDITIDTSLMGYDPVVQDKKHQSMQGTSMACPHVTGACALLLSKHPDLDEAQVKQILLSSTRKDAYTGNDWNATWGYGKLDVKAAYDSLTPVSFSTAQDFVKQGWNLISLPSDPVDATPTSVFSGIDIANASLQYWDNSTDSGGFLLYGLDWSNSIKEWIPYWMVNTSTAKGLSYSGIRRHGDQTLDLNSHTTAPYWIAVGQVFDHSTPCDSVLFSTTGEDGYMTWSEAVDSGVISSMAQGFDATAGTFFTAAPSAYNPIAASLDPWKGYWILVMKSGPLSIRIPENTN